MVMNYIAKKAVTKTIMWSLLALKGNFIFLHSIKRLSRWKSSFAATRHVRFFAVPGKCSVFPLLNLCLPCPFVWNVFALFKISFSEVHHQCYFSCETSLDEPSWNTFFLVLSQNSLVATISWMLIRQVSSILFSPNPSFYRGESQHTGRKTARLSHTTTWDQDFSSF